MLDYLSEAKVIKKREQNRISQRMMSLKRKGTKRHKVASFEDGGRRP